MLTKIKASCRCRCPCGFCGQRVEGFEGIRMIKQRITMSQDTKRANPQTRTNNQRNNFCLDSPVQNSTLFLAISSYTNKGISGPLIERMPPLKLNFVLQVAFKKGVGNHHQFDIRGEITNIATLIPFAGMVRS